MIDLLRRVSSCPAWRLGVAVAIAAAALAAPREADAFCRTTTTPIPASYSPTRGCFVDGLPLFWRGACIGYSVNSAASASIPLAEATRVIDEGFSAWNASSCGNGAVVGIQTSNLGPVDCNEVRYNTSGPNQNVIVFRDTRWPYSDPNNTLGLTTVTFNADTGEIYDADMEINATGSNLSTSATVPSNGFDLLSVITHEAGHFLGLAHATEAGATMFASYKPGTSALRSLSADDVDGLCAIYPDASQRRVDARVDASGVVAADACDPSPRHGFGSQCAENPPPAEDPGGCAVSADPAPIRGSTVALAAGLALLGALRRRRCRRA